jgi:hypothetical protein
MLEEFYDNVDEIQKNNDILQDLMDSNTNKDVEEENDEECTVSNKYVECLNIHQIYFKNLHNKDTEEHMLHDIHEDKQNSTNRSIELFYESLHAYKIKLDSDPDYCDIYEASQLQHNKINDFTSMFLLKIDGSYHKLSPSLFAIISYIAHYIDWKNVNWHIISLKNSD